MLSAPNDVVTPGGVKIVAALMDGFHTPTHELIELDERLPDGSSIPNGAHLPYYRQVNMG